MKKIFKYAIYSLLELILILSFITCKNEDSSNPIYYTVAFDSDGGSTVASQSIEEGKTAVEPKSPTKENCEFIGWFIDDTEFDFSTKITSNLTLLARWENQNIENNSFFKNIVHVSSSQAAEEIENATDSILIELSDAPSEDTISDIKAALFSLAEKYPEILVGIDFSKIGETQVSSRTILPVQTKTNFLTMPDEAFYSKEELCGAPNLRSVIMPEGMTEIGNKAFKGCSALVEIEIPVSVTAVGTNVFEECTSLDEVVIPDGVETLEEAAFKGCTSLKKVTIPDSVKKICNEAFYNCDRLEKIKLPSALTEIGNFAFYGCQTIKSVAFPRNVQSIGEKAFCGTSLSTVRMYAGNISLGNFAFDNCGYFDLIIAKNDDSEAETSFSSCDGLKSVEFEDGITVISGNFSCCKSLNSVSIPSSVKTIKGRFSGNKSLEELIIPEGCETLVGTQIFADNPGLKKVVLPQSLTALIDYDYWGNLSSDAGYWLFNGCAYLEYVDLGGLTKIPACAFEGCQSLKELKFSDKITEIGSDAFRGVALDSFTIPKSVEIICHSFIDSGIKEIIFEEKEDWYYRDIVNDGYQGTLTPNYTYTKFEVSDDPKENKRLLCSRTLVDEEGNTYLNERTLVHRP